MALMPLEECARRPGALPPKRMVASWSGPHAGPTEYKVAAQARARHGGLPSVRFAGLVLIDTVASKSLKPGLTIMRHVTS